MFGSLLKRTLDEVGISSENLFVDEQVKTTLAFVHTFPDGDREFSFYRNPGADMMLTEENLSEMLCFANAGAALVTLKKGAIRVMPDMKMIQQFIHNNQK